MAITNKTAQANMSLAVFANSETLADQTHNLPMSISFDPTSTSDANAGLKVVRTDSSANFSASVKVGSLVSGQDGSIDSVLVGSDIFTEASGLGFASASGTTVTVSGSVSTPAEVHNVTVDFSEGDRSSYLAAVANDGTFSATHTYSYPGVFHLTTRVQSKTGYVDMDSFRLNMASDLSGSGLGALTITATPETAEMSSGDSVFVGFSASGASGISLSGSEDSSLTWRFGSLQSSNKISPSGKYDQPGTYIPVANYKYVGPSGTVYVSDITDTGAND